MDDLWFEETLQVPPEAITKAIFSLDEAIKAMQRRKLETMRVIVRIQTPRYRSLTLDETLKIPREQPSTRQYLIRLGFEFEVPTDAKRNGMQFVAATCGASLWSTGLDQPKVIEVIPQVVNEGERRKVSLSLGAKLKISDKVEVSLGDISSDVHIGLLDPACTGYVGDKEREPHWELKPKANSLIGIRNFWCVVDVPPTCPSFRISPHAEAEAQASFNPLHLIPRETVNERRRSITIPSA